MEDDIQNYLATVMFRGTPCTIITYFYFFTHFCQAKQKLLYNVKHFTFKYMLCVSVRQNGWTDQALILLLLRITKSCLNNFSIFERFWKSAEKKLLILKTLFCFIEEKMQKDWATIKVETEDEREVFWLPSLLKLYI